jgi:hypothetical protein
MTKKEEAATATAEAASAAPPAPPQHPKKRPASPTDKEQQLDTRPLHDDTLPPDVVEEGRIYFIYKPRVKAAPKCGKGSGGAGDGGAASSAAAAHAAPSHSGHVSSLEDVQRTFMLLSPLAVSDKNVGGEARKSLAAAESHDPSHSRPLSRLFVIPKKALPGNSAGEPRLSICVKTAATPGELAKGLEASTYDTKTRGKRLQPAARVVARGSYLIVAPTGPAARKALKAQQQQQHAGEEEDEEEAGEAPAKKKKKAAHASPTPAVEKPHGRPVSSARLLWLLDSPLHGAAQHMIGLEHRGAFAIKVKGPLGGGGAGGGGGWAPPPPEPSDLPEVPRARLTAATTQWVNVDSHACLDFKGAQMLMIAQYQRGGKRGGPMAVALGDEEGGGGGIKQDRAAMEAEAGAEVAAELADVVVEDERRLKADAEKHGELLRTGAGRVGEVEEEGGGGGGALGGAIRRALMAELAPPPPPEDEEGEQDDDWAMAHHEEAERQLREHEAQEETEEQERLDFAPALTGNVE